MNFIEKEIVRRLAKALLAKHSPVTVDGERGYDPDALELATVAGILKEVDQYDECHLFLGGSYDEGRGPFVYLVLGNGWDIISDYSTSLEPILKPVLEWIEANES